MSDLKETGEGRTMNPDGPWLTTALLCDRVKMAPEYRREDVLGVFNKITKEYGPPGSIDATLYLNFARGYAEGDQHVRIVCTHPSGLTEIIADITFLFTPGEPAVSIKAPFDVPVEQPGVVWFDIVLNGELATRTCALVRFASLP